MRGPNRSHEFISAARPCSADYSSSHLTSLIRRWINRWCILYRIVETTISPSGPYTGRPNGSFLITHVLLLPMLGLREPALHTGVYALMPFLGESRSLPLITSFEYRSLPLITSLKSTMGSLSCLRSTNGRQLIRADPQTNMQRRTSNKSLTTSTRLSIS